MSTETAVTEHGEVSYETVECTTCDNTVAKEDANDVIVGDIQSKTSYSHNSYTKFKISDGYKRGYLCSICSDAETVQIDRSNNLEDSNTSLFKLVGGVLNAHSTYIDTMTDHLNGEWAGVDDDIIIGLMMLAVYLFIIIIIGSVMVSLLAPLL